MSGFSLGKCPVEHGSAAPEAQWRARFTSYGWWVVGTNPLTAVLMPTEQRVPGDRPCATTGRTGGVSGSIDG